MHQTYTTFIYLFVEGELLPINEELKKNLFKVEIRAKNNEIRLLRADNNRLQMEISTCTEEKNGQLTLHLNANPK